MTIVGNPELILDIWIDTLAIRYVQYIDFGALHISDKSYMNPFYDLLNST